MRKELKIVDELFSLGAGRVLRLGAVGIEGTKPILCAPVSLDPGT